VLYCLSIKALKTSDYLIIDNAGTRSWHVFKLCLEAYGVTLVYLPAYSPELNPCELVFGRMKQHIRNYKEFGTTIIVELLRAIAAITYEKMVAWFGRCIYPKLCYLIHYVVSGNFLRFCSK